MSFPRMLIISFGAIVLSSLAEPVLSEPVPPKREQLDPNLRAHTPKPAKPQPEKPADIEIGKKIYMKNCEVCHLIGRNLVNPEKEIQNSKLIGEPKKLKEFLSHKNGKMPAFTEISKNDEEIKHLREFLEYAKKNPSDVNKLGPGGASEATAH